MGTLQNLDVEKIYIKFCWLCVGLENSDTCGRKSKKFYLPEYTAGKGGNL